MLRLGVDVIEISRMRDSFVKHGDRFKKRIFTSAEQEYCDRQKDPLLHYAARFCAKEAVSKALKTGIAGGVKWTDIEILKDAKSQAPYVHLHGKAQEYYRIINGLQIEVSLAHSVSAAVATAAIITNQ
jgi:holo-[acyl-carrier protein] synthase